MDGQLLQMKAIILSILFTIRNRIKMFTL